MTVRQFYSQHHDRILEKRYWSPYWLRRYAHRRIYAGTLKYVEAGQTVLDAGCGEGVLSLLMARKGAVVTGIDISGPNISIAGQTAEPVALGGQLTFLRGDAESLPFPDCSFDVVVSSHVLEHLPSFEKGLSEIRRVMRHRAIISLPTCLNPCAWCLLGGDVFWKVTRRSPFGMLLGLARVISAWLRGEEGINEGYGGHRSLPHLWRFPGRARDRIERAGFRIESFEAGPLIFPWLAEYVPAVRRMQSRLDRLAGRRFWRDLGYGSTAVCRRS